MGIFDRLEYLIRSYLNDSEDESARIFGRESRRRSDFRDANGRRSGDFADPDVKAAFEELNEFLNRTPGGSGTWNGGNKAGSGGARSGGTGRAWSDAWSDGSRAGNGGAGADGGGRGNAWSDAWSDGNGAGADGGGRGRARSGTGGASRPGRAVPEELRPDFAELGVPFGASAASCKTAYKNLLKKHHPDRHSGRPENVQKATEKTARINAAWDRIEKWLV
jgi:hypothetical protein